MNKSTITGWTAVVVLIVLALVAGYGAVERDVDPVTTISLPTPPWIAAASEAHPSFLYGRVTTIDGVSYEGRLRWGGDEEAFWGNYFNGFKVENPWAAQAPIEQLTEARLRIEIFGFEILLGERQIDLGRPFMARFGDIAHIEARDTGVRASFNRGIEFAPRVRVTLKSGAVFDLDRLSAGDFDDGVRVWDGRHGVVDLGPRQIRTIELLPSTPFGDVPDRLYGTVRTRQGEFTGFLQWDRKESLGRDELIGHSADGELSLRFGTIRSIARHSRRSSLVTLLDGRKVVLSDTRKVGHGNAGVYVDDRRYGRVLVTWEAFERVDFSLGGGGPAYGDYLPGRPLTGSVTTFSGQRLAGRLVYDLDESETTETLDAPSHGVDYTIPFGLVASIVLPSRDDRTAGSVMVTLQTGEELHLERTGDLGERNAGMLIFVDGRERALYVPWPNVERVDFDRAPKMKPARGGH